MNEHPLILAFVKDLNFSVRIESAARLKDFQVKFIESANQISEPEVKTVGRQFAEPLEGREAILVDWITRWRPVLMVFDLGNDSIPWEKWINLLTSLPATRRIPVLCYGSHINIEDMRTAKLAGAKEVAARSRFVKNLPDLLIKHARLIDQSVLEGACQSSLSPLAVQGLEEFNRGEYFEAHESLEQAWLEDQTPGRELYQAVLQVAVAYYQILRGNYKGAVKMFLRVRQWIEPLPDVCRGVHIAKLRQEAGIVRQELLDLGPERISEFDRSLLKPVEYKD